MILLDAYLDTIKHLIPTAAELEIELMIGGYSNQTYLLSWNGQAQCVLRIPGLDESLFHVCRVAEEKALKVAVSHSLSPPCLAFNRDSGLMLNQFVPQSAFEWDVSHNDLNVIRLARSLRDIHNLPSNKKEYKLGHIISSYLRNASTLFKSKKSSKAATLHEEVEWLASFAQPYLDNIQSYKRVMCHNDLNPANCLADERDFWVIDWEYAGESDPLFDIALVFTSHNFTTSQRALFFQHYVENEGGVNVEQEVKRIASLDNYQKLYKIREMAWLLLKYATSEEQEFDLTYYDIFKQQISPQSNALNITDE